MGDEEDLWRCPECGRRFTQTNQSHSCVQISVDDHFKSKTPGARELFDLLLKQVKSFGPVRTDAVKSAINLTHQSHFAMVYVRKASLTIDLASEAPLMSDRVFRSEQLGPRLHLNYVILSEPEDIDNELLNWLRDAYDRAG